MPFTIPNFADAAFPAQAEPDKVDFDVLTQATGGTGVISGAAVSAPAANMTVTVAAGVIRLRGRRVAVTAGAIPMAAADATYSRFDLVTIDAAGAKGLVPGTAKASPTFPPIPANRVVLAAVYVPAKTTAITAGHLTDKRVMIEEPTYERLKWYAQGDGVADDTQAIRDWIAAGKARLSVLYADAGTYKFTQTIDFVELQGLHVRGAGVDQTLFRPTGPLAKAFNIDGAAQCTFSDFSIANNDGQIVDTMVCLDWTVGRVRSTTTTKFNKIYVYGTWKYGFAVGPNSGARQVDNTSFHSCTVLGGWTLDSPDTTKWQAGYRVGSDVSGNILDTYFFDSEAVFCKYGAEVRSTNIYWYGGQSGQCQSFLYFSRNCMISSVQGMRLEGCRRLVDSGSATSTLSQLALRDIEFNGGSVDPGGAWINWVLPGLLKLEQVMCGGTAVANPRINAGAMGGYPLGVVADGVAQQTPASGAFVLGPGAQLSRRMYAELNADYQVVTLTL